MVYYVFSSEKLLINHPLDSIVDLRVCPLPVRNWGYRGLGSLAGRWRVLEERRRLSEHLLAGFSKLSLHHTGTRLA